MTCGFHWKSNPDIKDSVYDPASLQCMLGGSSGFSLLNTEMLASQDLCGLH